LKHDFVISSVRLAQKFDIYFLSKSLLSISCLFVLQVFGSFLMVTIPLVQVLLVKSSTLINSHKADSQVSFFLIAQQGVNVYSLQVVFVVHQFDSQ